MNALEQLKRIENSACESCGTMRPECWVPDGETTHACCWLCAHAMVEHDMPLGGELTDCGCKRCDIYPHDVLSHMDGVSLFVEHTQDRTQKATPAPVTGDMLTLVTPMVDRRGRVVRDAPVLVQTFRKLGDSTVTLESAEIRPRIKRGG